MKVESLDGDIPYNVHETREEQTEPSNLTQCAREFKQMRPRYGDPFNSYGMCNRASNEFLRFLKMRGVVSSDMEKSGEARTHTYFHKADGHTDFRLGRIIVDWTARQFDPNAPFPLVYLMGEKDIEKEAEVNEQMRRRALVSGTDF